MDLSSMSQVIAKRATDDLTLTALITGFYSVNAPDDKIFPFCVFSIASADPNADTFTGDGSTVLFRIAVNEMRYPQGRQPLVTCSAIIARLIGDGARPPTYGFHRWQMDMTSLSSPWTGGYVIRGQQNENHQSDTYQFNLDFKVLQTR